jgi:penicillin-binding protein 1A
MAYTTKIRLKKKNSLGLKSKIYSVKNWQKSKSKPLSRSANEQSKKKWYKRIHIGRYKKVFYFTGGILLILLFVGAIYGFSYIQALQEKIPTLDRPFGKKAAATEIYDRNGSLLYRVYGDEDRDPVKISDVPFLLKWAFMAAEDKDFYKHGGVDIPGIIRCGFRNFMGGAVSCGASTIDQQLLKLTALGGFKGYERKIAEAIMAMQMEKQYSKDQILEMYLTVVPEGSNIYGVTRGAKVYFGKELKDCTLAELAILAAIPNDPNDYSPQNADGEKNAKGRQLYVLNAMENNLDTINANYREVTGKDEDGLTKEMLDKAREEVLVYKKFSDRDKLKAPHFVFYVEKLLKERSYNNGVPFTQDQIETSGLKIYTTLDLDYQNIAEEQVTLGATKYGAKYGADNAALMALDPTNGEILAMVGSKDYWGKEIPAGCVGSNCRFSGKVNVLDTLQSYGSTMKPMVYYMAMMKGLISPGSIMADIPIQIGNYKPKNYEGGFGGMRPARNMLRDSRNIPPITLVDAMGSDYVVAELKKWGYTTFTNPGGYGPAITVGGGDVKLIEHATGYAVLANGGYYIQNEAILKIVDRDGTVIYEYKPNPVQVADPRGTYMVSDILNYKKQGPGSSLMNRDVAGKTGTSDNATETLFATYTPEIVVVGWLGNNNNNGLNNANGNISAKPWIAGFYHRIEPKLKGKPFVKPAGVITAANCSADAGLTCDGINGDLAIAGINVPNYVSVKSAVVCKDQLNKLARPVDIALGFSTTISVKSYKMVDTKLQSFLDTYLGQHADVGGTMPTTYCDINRNPSGETLPWPEISPNINGQGFTTSFAINVKGFSPLGTVEKIQISVGSIVKVYNADSASDTIDISGLANGSHTVVVKVTDSTGASGSVSLSIIKTAPVATPTPTVVPTTTVPSPSATP